MTQWNRRETMPRFVFREQRDRNKERREEKRRKRLTHTMAGGREKLLARSSRSKNKVLVSKEKEPGIRKAVESNMGQFGVNEVYATPEPGIQPRNPQSCQHSAVSNHL